MGKMMAYALLTIFIIEVALQFSGKATFVTELYTALTIPSGFVQGVLWIGIIVILTLGALAVITPGFIYQVNQWALFAGASLIFIFFVAVPIELFTFIVAELQDFVSLAFASLIASLICAPIIVLYIMAVFEWTRFNQ